MLMDSAAMMHNIMDNSLSYPQCCTHRFSALPTALLLRKTAPRPSDPKDEQMRLIQDLQDFIRQQPTIITEFDETLVKRPIMKITVFEDHFTVEFKSGVTIDIEA